MWRVLEQACTVGPVSEYSGTSLKWRFLNWAASLNKTHFFDPNTVHSRECSTVHVCGRAKPFEHGPADCEAVFKVCLSCKVHQSR